MFVRGRTARWIILYGVYLYLSGLSLRRVSEALRPFADRCWTAVWLRVQGLAEALQGWFTPRARRAFVDEAQVLVHGEPWWLWYAYDVDGGAILRLWLSPHRSGLAAYLFLRKLRMENGVRVIYTDGGPWYPWASSQARLKHVVVGLEDANPWQRPMEAVKDRLRAFTCTFHADAMARGTSRPS
ncbi:MAG: DDE-type integrase/transposase/recombinase [Candidatus Bathyarchaeia archaeon]